MVTETARKREDYNVSAFNFSELNICDRQAVDEAFKQVKPNWVINCAAYTKIDASETNREDALRANIHGPQILGELAAVYNANVVHVSSALVFDGQSDAPYTEEDLTAPESIYGKTKRLGELALWKVLPRAVVVRASRLYGPYGRNFVNDILKAGIEQEEVTAVSDQYGSPTFSGDLALCIFNLIDNNATGLYHYANSGKCSSYEMAQAIFEEAAKLKITTKFTELKPILGLYLITPAKRPANLVFDTAKYAALPNAEIRPWRESLRRYMQNYLEVEQGAILTDLH